MNDPIDVAAPYFLPPPKKKADARRLLRVAMAEREMGIPWWKPRCKVCGAIIEPSWKSGTCIRCRQRGVPKSAPCRTKAQKLYGLGVPVKNIAKSCDISRERVYQFIRPTGMLEPAKEAHKLNTRARRRSKTFNKRAPYRRRQIMKRYFAMRLYKAGYGINDVARWVPSAQSIITKAGLRRPRGYRNTLANKNHFVDSWEPFCDGEWHRVKSQHGRPPNSIYKYGTLNGYTASIRRVSAHEFLVRLSKPGI